MNFYLSCIFKQLRYAQSIIRPKQRYNLGHVTSLDIFTTRFLCFLPVLIITLLLLSCANVTMICDQCWFVISRDLILIIGLSPSPVSAPSLTSVTCLHSPDCVHYSSPALQPDNNRLCELWAAAAPWSDVITASPRLQIKTVERVTQHTISLALSVFTTCCHSHVYDMTRSSLMLAPGW